MSCQSLAPARAFTEDKDGVAHCGSFHRSVRFSSESQTSNSVRASTASDCRKETPGSMSLTALTATSSFRARNTSGSIMSQSAPSCSNNFGDLSDVVAPPLPSNGCRFPKLEECAHFHYERVSLGGLRVSVTHCAEDDPRADCVSLTDSDLAEGWVCLKVRSHVNDGSNGSDVSASLNTSWRSEGADLAEWTVTRNAENFLQLDDLLHRCIYDRKVSGLMNLSEELTVSVLEDRQAYERLVADYVHHLSIIADDSINCGPILNWLQMDNKGHRLLVANEDSSSINTPAVAAAYSVRKYVSQARDEISFDVGDMISIIDMPGPQESLWWRGKRGFKVGFFPHHCVAVIGDKVPRHMTQPPPIVGSVAVAPIKPVLRKHGKLISLFRSFILSRPSRRALKQQGILRERVFGCDLGEHLLNCGQDVPLVLVECARIIEERGAVDGVYRLSGGSGLTQRLRAAFDEGRAPPLNAPAVLQDIHAVASLLKMYFRELPNPLCTYQLYEGFVSAAQAGPEDAAKLKKMRDTIVKLPPPHYRTLSYLMRHLRRVSLLGHLTGMTARNMAIVWAPNLLRSPRAQYALQGVAVQAVVTEFLICYAEELFSEAQGEVPSPSESPAPLRAGGEPCRRPKSLPLQPPTKLLSLEEARQRGGLSTAPNPVLELPPPSGAIAALAQANTQLRPSAHLQPKYIEVGSGPNNLPQYHTVLELPGQGGGKRGLKRSPSGWRGLFSKNKQVRGRAGGAGVVRAHSTASAGAGAGAQLAGAGAGAGGGGGVGLAAGQRAPAASCSLLPLHSDLKDVVMAHSPLRPVKSCESLKSETDTLGPLSASQNLQATKQHTRSASCDSYFEPWQAELADMRLRLSPQERDNNIFSEEDDTTVNCAHHYNLHAGSVCSSPLASDVCSVEPSPRRGPKVNHTEPQSLNEDTFDTKRYRSLIEEQLSSIGYIDGTESPVRAKPSAEKRHSDECETPAYTADEAKRPCKEKDSPHSSIDNFQTNVSSNVKMRERNSPRKQKGSNRYSGFHHPLNLPDKDKTVTNLPQKCQNPSRVTWHGSKEHSTLIKIDWPLENTSINSLTASTLNSSPLTPVTPVYDVLETDSDLSELTNTIKVDSDKCQSCHDDKKCLKCELNATDYDNIERTDCHQLTLTDKSCDSIESSPVHSTNISYQNLNRLSNVSTNSSASEPKAKKDHPYENIIEHRKSLMTSSHESSSSYSASEKPNDELYECYSFNRPSYLNLQSSSTSKSSTGSPLKSPLKSTISITFRTPAKNQIDYENVPGNRNSNYENIDVIDMADRNDLLDTEQKAADIDKNLSIVEDAPVPNVDACLPTQEACQPEDLIILESPVEQRPDIYSQVKFLRKSVDEINAMILESPDKVNQSDNINESQQININDYENVNFPHNYENVIIHSSPKDQRDFNHYDDNQLKITKGILKPEADNGNTVKTKYTTNLNVRELANRFESPTEVKGPFVFEKFKVDIKYPSLDRKDQINSIDRARSMCERSKKDLSLKLFSPKTCNLSKNFYARSLDENAFVKEFGCRDSKSGFEMNTDERDQNLNTKEITEERKSPVIDKISLIQKLPDKLNVDDNQLSRERIEKYKEERRNFLREKYASQSFRTTGPCDLKFKKKEEESQNILGRDEIEFRYREAEQASLDSIPMDLKNPERIESESKTETRSEEEYKVQDRIQPESDNSDTVQIELRNPDKLYDKDLPKFERRNTFDLGQRLKFSVNKSSIATDDKADFGLKEFRKSENAGRSAGSSSNFARKEKVSPSYNIKDMTAMFEQKSQNTG